MRTFIPKSLRLGIPAGVLAWVLTVPIPTSNAATNPVPRLETKDKVSSRIGVLRNGSSFTPNNGGRTGAAGDYAVDFGPRGSGPVHVADGSFLNAAAANDQLTVTFWTRKYDIAASSAFWAVSPGSSSGMRGYQAHVPWSDNTIYFDTAGCCNADTRISLNIADFPNYTGDISWWTNEWHHFAFIKNGPLKQIWIDGMFFHEGIEAAPLLADFTELFIGSDGTVIGNLYHGLIDDFAVYSTALEEASLTELASGALPNALPANAGLMAYWDFNDYPAEGQFITVTPTPNTLTASPNTIRIVHADGATPWTTNNVSLTVDGAPVNISFTKEGPVATVAYLSPTLFPIQSRHTARLTYPAGGEERTLEWEFIVGPYTIDSVASHLGVFVGGSGYTENRGGATGNAGDYAIDFGRTGSGPIHVENAAFLNEATANDELSFGFWMKKYDIAASSAFWAVAPSVSEGQRGFQAHVPWSDNSIYFDTAGCCDGASQRVSASIETFIDYSFDVSWWTNWHHFVFSKKGEVKQVWIDGILFLEGFSTAPLPSDFTSLFIGGDAAGGNLLHGVIDDFSVFSKQLTETDITALSGGTKPSALPGTTGLMAYWDFNDVPPQGIFLSFYPTPDSLEAAPHRVSVTHFQGTVPWDMDRVSMTINGSPAATSTSTEGSRLTITHTPDPLFAIGSTHNAVLSYPGPNNEALTRNWQFTVAPYILDSVSNRVARIGGAAKFTPDTGGRSGNTGDYGMDFGRAQAGQTVHIVDARFLNTAAASDQLAIAGWQKLHSLVNSAFFFGVSPSSNGGQRGFGIFPWSNSNIYFDTAGCCDAFNQRVNAHIDTFVNYTGDASWWTNWHHFVYQKNGTVKEIWIDGQLFLWGESLSPLPTDFTEAHWGFDVPDNARLQGILDDVAVFGAALDEAAVTSLASGTAPSSLPATTQLLAFWDFNNPPAGGGPGPTLTLTRNGNTYSITFTGSLESAETIDGAWSPVTGATNPYHLTTTGAGRFYRARN